MTISFGPFVIDSGTRLLTRDAREIHLSPKAFDLLSMLVEARPEALSKAVLQQRLWPDTFVAEANLSNLVAEIREALGDPSREPRYIRTVHRFGYAFCGAASMPAARRLAGEPPACWVEWSGRRFPLHDGEHVIGRDADASIQLDASTVSRRHARIVVGPGGAVLEDFDSKNGTFHRDARVTSPVRLTDGDAIRIGSQLVTFHVRDAASTETQVDTPS